MIDYSELTLAGEVIIRAQVNPQNEHAWGTAANMIMQVESCLKSTESAGENVIRVDFKARRYLHQGKWRN